MNPASVDIRDILVTQGYATDDYDSTGASDWFISAFKTPDRDMVISVVDSPAMESMHSLNNKHTETDKFHRPSIQITVRSLDFVEGYAKMEAIRDYLWTIHRQIINSTLYIEIIDRGDMLLLGQDPSNRFMWALNRTIIRQR